MKRFVFSFAAVMNLLLLDQIAKEAAVRTLDPGKPLELIGGLFNLVLVENRGCAWGLFQGAVWPLAAFGIVAIAVIIWKREWFFVKGAWGTTAELLLHAGILGNLIDRVARGCVIDMFDFHWGVHHFPVFNPADVYITIAAAILLITGLFEKESA